MLLLPLLLLTTATSFAVQESVSINSEQEPSIARFRLSFEPGGFDPVVSSQYLDAIMQRQVLECLTEYQYLNDEGAIQGCLATEWTSSKDHMEWTFTLRKDAAFYDPFEPPLWPSRSRPLVAQDVLNSWLRMADARTPLGGWWAMDGIFLGLNDFRTRTASLNPKDAEAAFQQAMKEGVEGIQVVDDHQLKIKLVKPDPDFLQRLAMTHFEVYPLEATQAKNRNMGNQPVGSGAFVLKSWLEGQTVIFARTPGWRGQESPFGDGTLPFLDQVEFHVVQDAKNAMQQFEKGAFDRISLGSSGVNYFLDSDFQVKEQYLKENYQVFDRAGSDVTMLCFGMRDPVVGHVRGDEEGNEKRRLLRQAIALTFPHKLWSDNVRGAAPADAARNFLPPVIPGSEQFAQSDLVATDLERARSLLKKAGYPEGKGLPPLELHAFHLEAYQSVAQYFQSTAAEVGIQIEILTLPHHEQQKRQISGQVQIFMQGWVLDWPDAALILQTFHGPLGGTDTNLSSFRNQEYDALYLKMRTMEDSPERDVLIARMLAILNHETPGVPIDHRRSWILTQPWFSNFRPHPFEAIPTKYFRVAPH